MSIVSRILALDYGRKRIGVAVSDPLGITAQAKPTIIVKNQSEALAKILGLIEEYEPGHIVIGLPLDQHGKVGKFAEEVRRFAEKLRNKTALPIEFFDERFSSKQAEKVLHQLGEKTGAKKTRIDALSAVLILQSYMEYLHIAGKYGLHGRHGRSGTKE
ncbi:Holliday junction resolvase RuvX [candidate division KSB1 bacterium]